uniref:TIAM Rac1 associated GEF 1a n=1 Tax=Oncorhynchus mykiss TaxID=8022 RepID=A0A8K9WLD4_ONCMY
MGNVESQNGDSGFYGNEKGHLSRKHTSRSLRLSTKHQQQNPSRRSLRPSAGKSEHRNSEASTRSSSTPSIPQSLVENGLEPFNQTDELGEFGINPHWTDRVAMTMRPSESFPHDDDDDDLTGDPSLATPTPETSEVDTIVLDHEGAEEEGATTYPVEGDDAERETDGEVRYLQRVNEGPREEGSCKKKRSKSADMWRDDSQEFSLSDLSQDHLTSTEEIIDGGEEEEGEEEEEEERASSRGTAGSAERASSLDHLCSERSQPVLRGTHNRYAKNHRDGELTAHRGRDGEGDEGLISPQEEEGSGYGAFTLPCRRSHCLSEGLSGHQVVPCPTFQGRRAQTTQVRRKNRSKGSEYGDSGIDGVATETDGEVGPGSRRRCKAMSASFSVYSAAGSSAFNGSDSGSSKRDCAEEAGSAESDERSSGTLSTAYPSDALIGCCAQGTVRKAGALAVKNFLVHKKNKKVEPATKRKWKHYWVCLKGCTLFLYETDGRSGIDHHSVPKHAVWAEYSILQAVPEHPKKDFVFCLSNSLGDAFLFQTSGQTELENWITAIHSACAAAVARQHHREDTVRLLRTEIRKLEQKIDMDEKMKKMGDMQLSAVTDNKKRKTILEQIFLWEQNLEQFHLDMFRCRCYLASLQGGELPNPKRLLAVASRATKQAMGRLGIFSVSSFHALVAVRTESAVRKRSQAMPRPSSKRRSRFSSLWGLDTTSKKKVKGRPSINQVFVAGGEPVSKPTERRFEDTASEKSVREEGSLKMIPQDSVDSEIWVPDYLAPSWVCLPNDQPVLVVIQPGETAEDTLDAVCKVGYLDYIDYTSYTLHLTTSLYTVPFCQCLHVGDEILLLNGKPASALGVVDMRSALVGPSLSLSVSTLPTLDPRDLCPFPPRRSNTAEYDTCTDIYSQSQGDTEQVTAYCRSLHEMNPSHASPQSSSQLSHADKLRKVISELVETERTYVKDLGCLIERYLTPLQKERFLTQDELDVLFGNLGEMLQFQVEFLKTLEDGTRLVANLDRLERVEQFKKVLFSLGGSFLYYADRFKIYSAFCASHTKVPKVLAKAKTDADFKAFLAERNPKQQHSSTLESYLIKPIQRILKYPLLLRELYSLTDPDSEEHYHLNVAMKAMNKVASHINEMQKLHEEYGAVFDQLINETTADRKEVSDLSMGDLLLHSTLVWINPPASLVKGKKDPELATFVFKTAVVFVYRDRSKQRKKLGTSHRPAVSDDRVPFLFRHMISTDSLQVRALTSMYSEGTAVCEIVHMRSESEGRPERTFHLCCSSVDSKKDFLKTVHSILRDKQRRQLMKTESLPLNQQYVPFGGKRLCNLKGNRPAMNRAVSAPSRTLGRRKLVRNRFTIDTDLPPHSHNPLLPTQTPQQQTLLATGGDTDRWVEEQFDLGCYDDQGGVKETDILSDDDEYCKSVRASSTEPSLLEERMEGATLEERNQDQDRGVDEEEREEGGKKEEEEERRSSQGILQEDEWGERGESQVDSVSPAPPPSRSPAPPVKLTPLRKQWAAEGVAGKQCSVEGVAKRDHCDVIWVRREDYANGGNNDVF